MRFLDLLGQDVQYAVRGLRRSPVFTATVVATLALGIGANAAMFGILDRLMLRPFPYLRGAGTVHRVYTQVTSRDERSTKGVREYTRYLDIARLTSSFDLHAGFALPTMAVGSGADSRERRVGVVSASFFSFFDAPPVRGRYFLPSEDTTPVGAPVSIVTYEFWQNELGGEEIVGKPLRVWNVLTTVVGITPPGFVGVFDADPPAVYLPITTYAGNNPNMGDRTDYFTRYNWGWMDMIVRRKSGVEAERANADLTQAMVKSWDIYVGQEPGVTPQALARPAAMVGAIKQAAGPDPSVEARTVWWVSGIAIVVLLIACSNVANLFLARALQRRRETAVRIALGGGRARLMRQWFTEAVLLALIGCAAGIVVAQWGGAGIRALFVGDGAPIAVATDWRTLGLAIVLSLAAALLTGLAPAIMSARAGIADALKAGVREGTQRRSGVRAGLVIFQVSLSLVLLVGAGLFVQSFARVRTMRLGFDVDRQVLVTRNMRGASVPDNALITLRQRMLESAESLPEVEHTAVVSSVPFWSTSSRSLFVAGIDSVRRLGRFTYQTATDDYFATMGTRIVRGRAFGSRDRAGSELVAVVSESMANTLWPGKDAIGQQMRVGSDTSAFTTVIGIAEDAVQNEFTSDDQRLRYYLPIDQMQPTGGTYLIARMRTDPAIGSELLRKAVQQVMPGDSYVTARPLGDVVATRQRSWRFGATMFAAFGIVALLVAAIGLHAVMAYDVTQRTHELGVRVALGAQARNLLQLVVTQGMSLTFIGVAIGTAIAVGVSGQVQPLLFEQDARDLRVYAAVAAVLLVSALLATLVPALRASRADPNVALRSD